MREIQPDQLFKKYCLKVESTYNEQVWKEERSIPSFPYNVQEISVLKKGILLRPSAFLKDSWKPALFVITDSGFLHCFELPGKGIQRRNTLSRTLTKSNPSNETPVYDQLTRPKAYYR